MNARIANHDAADFLADAEESLVSFATTLADVTDIVRADAPVPAPLVNQLFRSAHSLKGLAALAGRIQVSTLSHTIENVLEQVRFGRLLLDLSLIDLLSDAAELLEQVCRLSDPLPIRDQQLLELMQQRLEHAIHRAGTEQKIQPGILDAVPSEIAESLSDYERHRLLDMASHGSLIYQVTVSLSLENLDQDFTSVSARANAVGELISALPSNHAADPDSIAFDLLVASVSTRQALSTDFSPYGGTVTLLYAAAPAAEYSVRVESAIEAEAQQSVAVPPIAVQSTVRVSIDKLDQLLHAVGAMANSQADLLLLSRRLRQQGQAPVAEELERIGLGFRRRLGELQRGVLSVRLVPTAQLFDKLSLAARKLSRELDKEIVVRQFGAETELDKLIVDQLVDPLLHIIRNAIDHGIEAPLERMGAGKGGQGIVRLAAYQLGDQVAIEIEDDGSGIDSRSLVDSARERGLIQIGSELSENEALELMFLPGMTTAHTVTDISGRGVGMDVVKTAITALSGKIEVSTKAGIGTRFRIIVPTSLAIVPSLVVAVAGRHCAVPLSMISETMLCSDATISMIDDAPFIELRRALVPVVLLEQFFDGSARSVQSSGEQYLLICSNAERPIGIIVDRLLDQEDIVVKPLGPLLKNVQGALGAAELGEHGTVIVVDPAAVYRYLQQVAECGRQEEGGDA